MNVEYLERDGKPTLAYVYSPGENTDLPLVIFMGGYRSDMNGTKAVYLEAQCRSRGQSFVRFDYSGHGSSDSTFNDGTIGAWKDDALAVFDHVSAGGASVMVGSSMGGWIALLAARDRADQVKGLVGIAAAPDFTEEIYHERLDDTQRRVLNEKGIVHVPNDYSDEPYAYTLSFYQEAQAHLLMNEMQSADYPIRLIQGRKDIDVPFETALKIQETYQGADLEIIPVDEGDHRLSTPPDLILIDETVKTLSSNGF